MRYFTTILILTSILGQIICQTPVLNNYYPHEAYFVPLTNAANLQQELDLHKVIRLERGNYKVDISVGSDCKIYGLPETMLKYVTIEGGVTNSVISQIVCTQLIFAESDEISKNNLFTRIQALESFYGNECKLENNLFIDLDGRLDFITQSSGWLRNNKFIRVKAHGTWPSIRMLGDKDLNSYGNVFLWFNFLTPAGDVTHIENQRTLTIIGGELEGSNYIGQGTGRAVLDIKGGKKLTLFGMSGTQSRTPERQIQTMDVDVEKVITYRFDLEPVNVTPQIQLGSATKSLVFGKRLVNYAPFGIQADNPECYQTDIYLKENDTIAINGKSLEDFNGHDKIKFEESLAMERGKPWELYNHDTIIAVRKADSANWQNMDHTGLIQSMIDADSIAFLDSGVYYTSYPLLIGEGEGIIGWGEGKTVIRAKSDTFSIIENRRPLKTVTNPGFIIAQLSLENGLNGIRHHTDSLTDYHVLATKSIISHVEIYNMKHAGIYFDYSNGYTACFDNAMIDYTSFINCKFGLRHATGNAVNPYQPSYIDKLVFYRCKFMNDSIGAHMIAIRGSGLNMWADCLFKNNIEKDLHLRTYNKSIAALCKFESPYVSKLADLWGGIDFINCKINVGKNGAILFPYDSNIEGCDITVSNAELSDTSRKIDEAKFVMLNSTVHGKINTTHVHDGMFYNNIFESTPELNHKFVSFKDGNSATILESESDAMQGLLIDEYYPINLNTTKLKATTINIR